MEKTNLLDMSMLVLEPERQFLNVCHLMSSSMSSGLARPRLPAVFAFMGEDWNKLPIFLGDVRTQCHVGFVSLSVCLLQRY